MSIDISYYEKQSDIRFVIRNVSSQQKTMRVFSFYIPYNETLDLMAMPGVSEDDIRCSLVKGELSRKIVAGDLKIVESTINLQQSDASQAAFIRSALEVDSSGIAGANPGDTVILRPYTDPGVGYVTTWQEAVDAVNGMTSPVTYIYIDLNPDDDNFMIPGGEWNLNNTIICGGKPTAPDTDSSHRSYQELLYVYTEGNNRNHCRINGCYGLKDMYFRSQEDDGVLITANLGFFTPNYNQEVNIHVNDTYGVRVNDVLYLSGNGLYLVTAVNQANLLITIKGYGNGSEGVEINPNAELEKVTSVFYLNDNNGTNNEFVLDNCDFHFGNYTWGSYFVDFNGGLSIKLKNAASMRWYSTRVDGYLTLQSDGSACWIGYTAVSGNGYADIYPQANTEFHDGQSVDYSAHQPIIFYQPNNYSNWNGSHPTTVHDALDRLASAVKNASTNI